MDAVGEVSHHVRMDELRTQSFHDLCAVQAAGNAVEKEKNSDIPDHEHTMTNPVTDTSYSANPPCNNEECLPKLPLPVPVFPVQEMVKPSVQELEEPSQSDHMSMKKKKKSPNRETESASKHKSTKKRKTSSKSNNTFDVFGDPIDCS